MNKKRLPRKLFTRWNCSSPDEPFLETSEDAHLICEQGETVEAGVYELIKKVNLTNKTIVEPV